MAGRRQGTRINCEIPFTLTSLNSAHPFSESCSAILANPQGCAARSGRSFEVGTPVQLEGLPIKCKVTARVVNCISLGECERFWILGLALDEPGNVWGIETPPDDWAPQPLSTKQMISRALILCLDDNPTYLELRKKVLEREGYEILSVTTPDEAMKAVRDFPICAIITDHMLQGTNGTWLATEMKKIKPNVPIVLFSGTLPDNFGSVDVYINKGESTEEFLRIVRNVVRRFCS